VPRAMLVGLQIPSVALVVVPLDILQLLQLGYAIADLAAIEVEIGLACAGACCRPPLAERRSAVAISFGSCLSGIRKAGKSSLMRALTGREVLVADKLFATLDTTVRALRQDAHARLGHGRVHQEAAARSHCLVRFAALKSLAGLRLLRNFLRSDDARSAGDRRESLEPLVAEHRRAVDVVALLRHGADDLVTERLHEAAQLLDALGVRDIVGTMAGIAGRRSGRNDCFEAAGAAILAALVAVVVIH
jgi:hypothetical protein